MELMNRSQYALEKLPIIGLKLVSRPKELRFAWRYRYAVLSRDCMPVSSLTELVFGDSYCCILVRVLALQQTCPIRQMNP
jgi:hypothetical protein